MIANKKEFGGGVVLLIVFFVVLFFMFQPMFNGHNAMEYLDNLYNSISKGSVYYIPQLKTDADQYDSKKITLELKYENAAQAAQAKGLIAATGSEVAIQDSTLKVSGSLGKILDGSLDDSDFMYHNDGKALSDKYGQEARLAMFNWWTSLKLIDKALTGQNEFEAAKITNTIQKRAVEAAYNYYEVEPVQIMDKLGLVIFSLAFYVFYTLWYGFAILFMFEGWGLRLSH